MPENVITKHIVMDIKTGSSYSLGLNSKGECVGFKALNTVISNLDKGDVVAEFNQVASSGKPVKVNLPYGQTIHVVEMVGKDGEEPQNVFTIVLPKEKEVQSGAKLIVTKQAMPEDLSKIGFAPKASSAASKGKGIENEAELKKALETIDGMIGLDTAKREIKQNIAIARFNKAKEEMGIKTKPLSRHMVFTGNPGTGKTTFAREVAKVYHALGFLEKPEVVEVKREDLVAGYVGQTALKTKKKIDEAKGGVLFIDEAYSLSRVSGGSSSNDNDFGREAIDTLVAAMENMRDDLVVIVAGYPKPMQKFIESNEGLKSRFLTYIGFEDYNIEQLGRIMDVMIQDRGYTLAPDAREHAVNLLKEEKQKAKEAFGNGRTVRNLVEMAEKNLAERLEKVGVLASDHGKLSADEYKKALTTVTLEDVKAVQLRGLGQKENKVIDLGGSIPKNDNLQAAAQTKPKAASPK